MPCAIGLLILLVLAGGAPGDAFGQSTVPPVGPSSCVWGCGAGTAAGGGMGGMGMGALFGGIVAIGLPILIDALVSETTAPSAQSAQAEAALARANALRQAIEAQRTLQQARHNQLVASLLDAGEMQLLEDPGALSLLEGPLEQSASGTRRAFEGAAGAHAFWTRHHDAWFSTLGYSAQPVSAQPMPVSERALGPTNAEPRPLECVGPTPYGGQLCPFPNMRVSAVELETIELPPPDAPRGVSNIISQFSQSKQGFVSAFRRTWSQVARPGMESPDVLTTHFVDLGNQALPALQGSVAEQGHNLFKTFALRGAEKFFSGLNEAVVNPDAADPETFRRIPREALDESLGEALPGPARAAYLSLTGRHGDAGEALQQWATEHARGYARGVPEEAAREWMRERHWLLP